MYLVPLTVDNLSTVAETWQGYLQTRMEALAKINIALNSAPDGQAEDLRLRHVNELEAMSATANKYQMVLDAWEQKGGMKPPYLSTVCLPRR